LFLVVQKQVNICDVKDYDSRTPLHLAASQGALSTAEWLIASGVDLSAVDRFGRTPLMEALMNNHSTVAQLLLQVRLALWMIAAFSFLSRFVSFFSCFVV
jgi:ankyrin repeat protein